MSKVIVKIDLCSSKEIIEKSVNKNSTRMEFLGQLIEIIHLWFPSSTSTYPEGSFYRSEGDAVYLFLDKPTVALRATVDFMKSWYSKVGNFPDCRAVIAYGKIDIIDTANGPQFLSEALEDISKIEKSVSAGQIMVTNDIKSFSDPSLFQFINENQVQVTTIKSVIIHQLNYEDPRLVEESALVHALFVADPNASLVREKTYEALIIEFLISHKSREGTVIALNEFLKTKSCPMINNDILRSCLENSAYLYLKDNKIVLKQEFITNFDQIKHNFKSAKKEAEDLIATGFSDALGLENDVICESINLPELIERYLCSVFLEIRMMANYYKSTEHFYSRLEESSDFDHVFRIHFKKYFKNQEGFLLLKKLFLKLLRKLTNNNNKYVSSIFHNVLMLYYLNRNNKYISHQLNNIKNKKYYFDTNVLYALMCRASGNYDLLHYIIDKLKSIGVMPIVFDQSVKEYNESLLSALRKYKRDGNIAFQFKKNQPWIWSEYIHNSANYAGSFEYCVKMHTIPKDMENVNNVIIKDQIEQLTKMGLQFEILTPYEEADELGEYYRKIYDIKKQKFMFSEYFSFEDESSLENIVKHDANCLKKINCDGDTPYDLSNIFITCDYRLAKARKGFSKLNCATTVAEFQEFMTPYLLLSDAIEQGPVSIPNFLLAASIDLELSHTIDFEQMIGEFLINKDKARHDYKILESTKNKARFEHICKKLESVTNEKNIEEINTTTKELLDATLELRKDVALSVAESIAQKNIDDAKNKIKMLEDELSKAKIDLAVAKKKEKGRLKYEKAQKRKNSQ